MTDIFRFRHLAQSIPPSAGNRLTAALAAEEKKAEDSKAEQQKAFESIQGVGIGH